MQNHGTSLIASSSGKCKGIRVNCMKPDVCIHTKKKKGKKPLMLSSEKTVL